jgi:predicted secreted protein
MNFASRRLACVAIAAAAMAPAFGVLAQLPPPSPPPPAQGVLGLSASASVEIAKDLLSITFSTSREGADANGVQSQLKEALDAALTEAKKAAKPGQVEVQTGNFSLYPRYAPKGGINGWQGSAELIVEGRDVTGIGQLAGRIATMTIAHVAYRLSREASEKVEGDVAAEAISRYRAKAALYAKQFGYAGYTIREVNLSTNEPQDGPIRMARAAPAAMSASSEPLAIEPGKATVTATVNGTVQMK